MKLNDQIRADMTPDELAVLDGKPAPQAGADPGDDEQQVAAADHDDDGQPTGEAQAAEGEPAQEAQPATEEAQPEPAAEVPAPSLPQYDVATTDFQAQRDALKAERREVETKWSGGELTDDERVAALEAIQDKADALLIEQTRASTLTEANAQAERRATEQRVNAENAAMKALAQAEAAALAAKKPAIDYVTDKVAQTQFDMMFSAVKADPTKAGLSAAQQVAEAHKAVRALRGMVDAPAPAPAPTPNPRARIPQTLGNLPTAAAQPVGVDLAEQLDAIDDPDVLEAKWATLPASQRQAMLRSTLPQARRR